MTPTHSVRKIYITATAVILILISAFFALPLPGTIPVLMYHHVGSKDDAAIESNYVSREAFDAQIRFIHSLGYRVLSMREYDEIKSGKRKPRGREIVITFDDGYNSFAEEAFPILKKYNIPSTVFIISHYAAASSPGYMTKSIIKKLHETGLVTLGAHTVTHPHLREIESAQIQHEILGSKQELESLFNLPVDYFAYPFGEFNREALNAVKESGYRLAFITGHKRLRGIPEDLHCLTRIKINRVSDNPFVFWYFLSGIHQTLKSLREKLRDHQPESLGWKNINMAARQNRRAINIAPAPV